MLDIVYRKRCVMRRILKLLKEDTDEYSVVRFSFIHDQKAFITMLETKHFENNEEMHDTAHETPNRENII